MLGKPIFDCDILPFDPAKLAQLLPECVQENCHTGSSAIIQETYAGDFPCLLRVGKRNICQKKSCQQPESDSLLHVFVLASCLMLVYRITLSARARTFGGIVRPICLAVLRLMV